MELIEANLYMVIIIHINLFYITTLISYYKKL